MNYRKLGTTGIEVSEIGYGAWGIGGAQWGGADDDESIQALHRAIDLGLNFIDSALAYGEGRSERLVGQVVRERPETIYVATKVPPKNLTWPAAAGSAVEEVFPGDHVRACAERSLANLGLERIDLLQLHVWKTTGPTRATGARPSTSCAPPARSPASASRSTTTSPPTPCG